jgi:hypothetical protein
MLCDNMSFTVNFDGKVGGLTCLGVVREKRNCGVGLPFVRGRQIRSYIAFMISIWKYKNQRKGLENGKLYFLRQTCGFSAP